MSDEKTPKENISVIGELIAHTKNLETLVHTVLSTARETEKHSKDLLELFTQFSADVESVLTDHEKRLNRIEQECSVPPITS